MKSEKKKFIAFNRTDCASIQVFFSSGEMEKITFVNKPVARLIPIKDVKPEEERFKGFNWNPGRKPKNKQSFLEF